MKAYRTVGRPMLLPPELQTSNSSDNCNWRRRYWARGHHKFQLSLVNRGDWAKRLISCRNTQKKRERERTSKKWREWKNGERTGREIDEEKASSVSSIRRFIYCTWLNHGGARTFSTFALLWNGSKEQRRRTKRKCAVNKCLSGRLNLYKLGQAPHSFADLAKHVNTIINWNWKWIAHWGWMDHSAARSVSSFQCMVPSATLQVIPLPKLCFWGPELVRTA